MTVAAELLQDLKAHDDYNVGIVTLVKDNRLLERLVAAWPNVARCLVDGDPDERMPADLPSEDRARWLWARVEPDVREVWLRVSGLPAASHVYDAIEALQHNGAVFPDGTMSKWIYRYLVKRANDEGITREELQEAQEPEPIPVVVPLPPGHPDSDYDPSVERFKRLDLE